MRAIFPEWRIGQMVANLVATAGREDPGVIWDMEDEQLLTAIHQHIADLSQRAADVA